MLFNVSGFRRTNANSKRSEHLFQVGVLTDGGGVGGRGLSDSLVTYETFPKGGTLFRI